MNEHTDPRMFALTPRLTTGHHYIGGGWTGTAQRYPVIDPSTGTRIAEVIDGSLEEAGHAVDAARIAFDEGPWPKLSGRERSRVLLNVAKLMRERADALAALESLDVGKPITLASVVDVNNAADYYEYAASLAQNLDGAARPIPLPAHAYTIKEPMGVVVAITPFNFPLILSSSKLAFALAAGNTVVHKPAPDTPLSALAMAELLTEAGVPDGVVNVITGRSPELGQYLVRHPAVNKVAFTGSTTVGSRVAQSAGEHLRPMSAELGGNGPNLVFADADIDRAVETIIGAFTFNSGQFCMSGSRVLVERPIYDEVLTKLKSAVARIPVGDPSNPEIMMGPLSNENQLIKVESAVQKAVNSGAELVAGGSRINLNGGYYFEPTVIADVADDVEIVCEEIFGPVVTVQPFDTEAEAIERANGTRYGLAAGVQCGDISRAHRVVSQLQAGITWVNGWGLLDAAMPFGGVKDSGWGREGGPEMLASYQHVKSVVIAIDA